MPKHAPSFKHLVAQSATPPREPPKKERTVNDLLAASRARDHVASGSGGGPVMSHRGNGGMTGTDGHRDHEPPPHLRGIAGGRGAGLSPASVGGGTYAAGWEGGGGGERGQDRAWRVLPGQTQVLGPAIADEGFVHPAELLRRAQAAQRAAGRSVAGPPPPPSWRPTTVASPSSLSVGGTGSGKATSRSPRRITEADLRRASTLLSHHVRAHGTDEFGALPATLIELCMWAIIRALHDDTVLAPEAHEAGPESSPDLDAIRRAEPVATMAEAMHEQVRYLEPHHKVQLIDLAAMQPEGSAFRFSDGTLRAILARPPDDWDVGYEHDRSGSHGIGLDDDDNSSASHTSPHTCPDSDNDDDDDWAAPAPIPTIHHLSLTLHPSPLAMLREIPHMPSVGLTSLNLAHCHIRDLERLAGVLPPGLRELGLAGATFGTGRDKDRGPSVNAGGAAGMGAGSLEDARGMAVLGRRLLVLRVLDLSFIPHLLTTAAIGALLKPAKSRVPSLRTLGLRSLDLDSLEGERDDFALLETDPEHDTARVRVELRAQIKAIARDPSRPGLLDIVW